MCVDEKKMERQDVDGGEVVALSGNWITRRVEMGRRSRGRRGFWQEPICPFVRL